MSSEDERGRKPFYSEYGQVYIFNREIDNMTE